MMTKLFATLFLFSISLNLFSAPMSADCVTSLKISSEGAMSQVTCDNGTGTSAAKDQQTYASDVEKEALAYLQLSKRSPSLIESLLTILFIPGLILLWLSRFLRSNK